MTSKISTKMIMIISSCDKYSDLWKYNIQLLNENWPDRDIDVTILTDKKNNMKINGVDIYAAGNNCEMPQRLKKFLNTIDTEYILLTLDDYYVNKKINNKKILKSIKLMDNLNLDYLRFWPYPHEKRKNKIKNNNKIFWISLTGNYKVNLYPGIWRKSFLEKTLKEKLNAWEFEVSLTKIANMLNAKCAYSINNEFPILDVIRKGKILHKAKKYLESRSMHLNRPTISYFEEIKLTIMYYSKEIFPKPILKVVKKIMEKLGYRFFSEGI